MAGVFALLPAGVEPARISTPVLETGPLDHSGKAVVGMNDRDDRFRSCDLLVMGQPRFLCATSRFCDDSNKRI